MNEYINYLLSIGADKIPHKGSNLFEHSNNVSEMLLSYGRSIDEQKAGLFHSIYGTKFQRYEVTVGRDTIRSLIGERSEHLVHTFCTLEDRVNTILYGKRLEEPDKTSLRWIEYCNIRDQYPNGSILKEFELVLKVGKV